MKKSDASTAKKIGIISLIIVCILILILVLTLVLSNKNDKTKDNPADVEEKPEISWQWSEDFTSAEATFVTDGTPTKEKAEVTADITPATCLEKGETVYTATANFNGKDYTDEKRVPINALGHNFGEANWIWSEDNASATAVFTCANDNSHTERVTAIITSKNTATCDSDGEIIYSATANFNDKDYTDEKREPIKALGHDYGDPKFTWNGYESATAVFTCTNDNSHTERVTTIITSKNTATCESDGEIIYTATANFNDKDYTDEKREPIKALGHNYGEAAWKWAEDGSKATVTFTCERCNDKQTPTVTISKKVRIAATCKENGVTEYTATATFNGKPITATKEVTDIPMLPHAYEFTDWVWSYDNKEATAVFTCIYDNIDIDTVTVNSESKNTATCETDGEIIYTAKANYNGKDYTGEKRVFAAALGHYYTEENICGRCRQPRTIGLTYEKSSDGTYYTVTGIGTVTDIDIYIPAFYKEEGSEELPVTSIGKNAFQLNNDLKSVSIPEGVTSIGSSAFYNCKGLTSVSLPNGLTVIKDQAFALCSNLNEITIPDSVTAVEFLAFRGCSALTKVTIGADVTDIGFSAFGECHRLVEVYNRSSHITVTAGSSDYGEIGYYAKNVYTPTEGASKLTTDENRFIIYDGNTLVSYVGTETEITIPDGITVIKDYAFYKRSEVKTVIISDGVESIGDYAFYDCTGLTSVMIPDSVTNIGNSAFYSCTSLTNVTYEGLKEQWSGITLGENLGIDKIICSNGEIALS